uniref:uncharacterized protein LOC104265909 isoform X3 n=1 Tax=Ciona intestinalis TaxID=7719 RepID=UPI00089DB2FE|nr:uncharacterized protein LOC104265909 isoform X3 [Ciona intestinalis]XP_026691363.1 uncharacterized protein LOC104265909 isoform X2 [Ciona intestinalis]|eukprot:XP_018668333.1 uncharacterized protein LOC104265909 isoform X3 [Ciona intestinalis]
MTSEFSNLSIAIALFTSFILAYIVYRIFLFLTSWENKKIVNTEIRSYSPNKKKRKRNKKKITENPTPVSSVPDHTKQSPDNAKPPNTKGSNNSNNVVQRKKNIKSFSRQNSKSKSDAKTSNIASTSHAQPSPSQKSNPNPLLCNIESKSENLDKDGFELVKKNSRPRKYSLSSQKFVTSTPVEKQRNSGSLRRIKPTVQATSKQPSVLDQNRFQLLADTHTKENYSSSTRSLDSFFPRQSRFHAKPEPKNTVPTKSGINELPPAAPDPPDGAFFVEKLIGPKGDTLVGNLFTFQVLPNTVSTETLFMIWCWYDHQKSKKGNITISPVVQCHPKSVKFPKPVKVTLNTSYSALDHEPVQIKILRSNNYKTWSEHTIARHGNSHKITFECSQLGRFKAIVETHEQNQLQKVLCSTGFIKRTPGDVIPSSFQLTWCVYDDDKVLRENMEREFPSCPRNSYAVYEKVIETEHFHVGYNDSATLSLSHNALNIHASGIQLTHKDLWRSKVNRKLNFHLNKADTDKSLSYIVEYTIKTSNSTRSNQEPTFENSFKLDWVCLPPGLLCDSSTYINMLSVNSSGDSTGFAMNSTPNKTQQNEDHSSPKKPHSQLKKSHTDSDLVQHPPNFQHQKSVPPVNTSSGRFKTPPQSPNCESSYNKDESPCSSNNSLASNKSSAFEKLKTRTSKSFKKWTSKSKNKENKGSKK